MKYKHWDEYTDAKRWEVSKKEAELETNNGTTKEDLNNIIKFLVQIADTYATDDLVDEVKKPVTWQEAILEFAKGKKVTAKFNGQEWSLVELIELPEYLNRAITCGKWYVED